jgi:protein-S-isoprenylcysteine O-methyltransferase Ste14
MCEQGSGVLDFVVSVVAVITLGSFIWAVYGHFQSRTLPLGAKVVSLFALATGFFLMAMVLLFPQPAPAALAGIVAMLTAELLFWSAIRETRAAKLLAAFTTENPHGLVTTGPYRYVRHPFYTSYLVYWAGFSLASWSVWSIPPLIGLIVMYWRAAIEEEMKFTNTPMANAYADYKRRTGRFFPKFASAGA